MNVEEIISGMEVFTQEELARINQLDTDTAENITSDDLDLYARWKTTHALAEARFEAQIEAIQTEMNAKIEAEKQIANAAIANLEAQAALARAQLEAVKNGEI